MEVTIEVNAYSYRTPLGCGYLLTEGGEVGTIMLPGCGRTVNPEKTPPRGEAAELLLFLEAYFKGEERGRGPLVPTLLRRTGATGFTLRVLEVVAVIPYGETCTYGEIAEAAGSPRGARAVGNIMARNPYPVVVPCHRVIRSTGKPGGFGGGPWLKAWMLELESGSIC